MTIGMFLVSVQLVLIVMTFLAFLDCRSFNKWEREKLAELRATVSSQRADIERLTPPKGQFRFEWYRENLPDDEFRAVVRHLIDRDCGCVQWDAEVIDLDGNYYRNKVAVHTTDKQEAMLFKLTFGGA